MRILMTSDTHEKHRALNIKPDEADVLVVAGDFTLNGEERYVRDFNTWLGEIDIKHKVIIPGNHDLTFDPFKNPNRFNEYRDMITNGTLLINSGVQIDGVGFYGVPDTPFFFDWAFNRYPDEMEVIMQLAVEHHRTKFPIDVLITHGPPYNTLDGVWTAVRDQGSYRLLKRYQEHVGCKATLKAVQQIKPKIHVFGHIHSGYGSMWPAGTDFYNVAFVDETYMPAHKPFLVYLGEKDESRT